jgi:hypothetical protein
MMKLFREVDLFTAFHYGDKPERELVKTGEHTAVVMGDGRKHVHPDVLVFQNKSKPSKSIYSLEE